MIIQQVIHFSSVHELKYIVYVNILPPQYVDETRSMLFPAPIHESIFLLVYTIMQRTRFQVKVLPLR